MFFLWSKVPGQDALGWNALASDDTQRVTALVNEVAQVEVVEAVEQERLVEDGHHDVDHDQAAGKNTVETLNGGKRMENEVKIQSSSTVNTEIKTISCPGTWVEVLIANLRLLRSF